MNRDEALSSLCQHSHYYRLSLELHVYIYISSIESLCMQGVAALIRTNWCMCLGALQLGNVPVISASLFSSF